MADWVTISSLATAGGTLVLAVATFSSVRSANRSARVAELSLMAGQRPTLVTSKDEDPPERVRFGDGYRLTVPGHGGAVEYADESVYIAIGLRNGGTGLAVIHGWRARVAARAADVPRPELEEFRRQQIDLYIPPGDRGYWLGAVRDPEDPDYTPLREAAETHAQVMVDLLYGDYEGGQRAIVRIGISDWPDIEGERATVVRYWNVDLSDPR